MECDLKKKIIRKRKIKNGEAVDEPEVKPAELNQQERIILGPHVHGHHMHGHDHHHEHEHDSLFNYKIPNDDESEDTDQMIEEVQEIEARITFMITEIAKAKQIVEYYDRKLKARIEKRRRRQIEEHMRLAKEQQEAQAERQTDQKEEEEKETPNPEPQDRLIKIPKAKTLAQLIEEQELLKQSETNIDQDERKANETDLHKDKILSKSNIEDDELGIDKQESQKDEMDDIDSIKNLSEHHRLHKQQDRLEVQSEEQD